MKKNKPEMTQIDFAELCEAVAQAKRDLEADCIQMATETAEVEKRHADKQSMLQEKISAGEKLARKFAKKSPGLFGEKRSIDLVGCRVGYRLGNWVCSLPKGFTLKDLAQAMRSLPWARQYVRTVYEVDKEALIADRDKLAPEQLAELGVTIDQEDRFFIDPTGQNGVGL